MTPRSGTKRSYTGTPRASHTKTGQSQTKRPKRFTSHWRRFSWGDPPDCISCYRKLILNQHGLDWPDIKREPRNGVFSLVVKDIRDEKLGVAFDPIPETDRQHPRDVATH